MAPAILDRCPTVSEDLVDFWTLVAFGSASAVKRRYGVRRAAVRSPLAVLQRIVRGRIIFTPCDHGHTFEAPTRFDK